MQITNPPQSVPFVTTLTGSKIDCKVIDFSAWDMLNDDAKSVAHGLASRYTNILSVEVYIVNDVGTIIYPLAMFGVDAETYKMNAGVISVDSTNINMSRVTAGFFASGDFSNGSIPRGKILIWILV